MTVIKETQVIKISETKLQIITVGTQGPPGGGLGGGDHGALSGLGDDDHPQYHNDARGDARYAQLGHTHTASQITDFSAAADARIANARGANNGIAPLDSGGKVPATNLPNSDSVSEGSTNLYFTALRAISSAIAGFSPAAGVVSASDTILQAIQKIVGNLAALVVNTLGGGESDKAPSVSAVNTALGTKQATLSLTTTGTSGAATLIGATLNIPQYAGGAGAAITAKDEGTTLTTSLVSLDFVGPGVVATHTGSGAVQVSVPNNGFSVASDVLSYANLAAFPGTGVGGVVYYALDSGLNYRWDGTTYVLLTNNVASYNGRGGAVMPQAGDYTTAIVADTTNKRYVTDAEKAAIAAVVAPIPCEAQINVFAGVDAPINLLSKAHYTRTILGFDNIVCSSGSINANFKINTTSLPGMSAVAITTTTQDKTVSSGNVVTAGDALVMELSGNSGATFISMTMYYTRTLA